MTYQNILVEANGQVQTVYINRPESLNALNSALIAELSNYLDAVAQDSSCRCVIITGSGPKAFVAGADIKEFVGILPAEAQRISQQNQIDLFDKIEALGKPVIAAINGFALGGGLELAMACHIRYASDNAKMGLPEVSLGLIPGYGGTQRLRDLVGKGWANQLVLSAGMINAQKAKEIHLVNEVFAQEELLAECQKLASQILKQSSNAVSLAIQSINADRQQTGFDTEIQNFGKAFAHQHSQEGIAAFVEKRPSNFN
jgi:enoyl-CoA hydratase